ncbi:MAG TPA: class I SAM-dependent methyltransferase [Mycobacteriales bacterium]|nr:class I SAM-dependent methyltransferase [Mycobacteriales bacterium]
MNESRWATATGGQGVEAFNARFAALAAAGADLHGEARFVASLARAGGLVLDAGCGTGRVALKLAELGFRCVGIDSDPAMLAQARETSTDVRWVLADLLDVDQLAEHFDLVVTAGNVMPLLAPGTEAEVVGLLADRLAPGGLLVAGFGLDPAHLPLAEAPFGLPDYDRWCAAAGLELVERFATWDRTPYESGGYAVSVHRRPG